MPVVVSELYHIDVQDMFALCEFSQPHVQDISALFGSVLIICCSDLSQHERFV